MNIDVKLKENELEFPFEKYSMYILSVLPKQDIIGINEINFVEYFSQPKGLIQGPLACYIQGKNGKNAIIEINVPNIIKAKAPKYLFNNYPEIAALLLSESIGHEAGHHVHTFRRHGVKKKKEETFAEQYARATYYHYLKSREPEIIKTYEKAGKNSTLFDKEGRKLFIKGKNEILNWLEENKRGIPYP